MNLPIGVLHVAAYPPNSVKQRVKHDDIKKRRIATTQIQVRMVAAFNLQR